MQIEHELSTTHAPKNGNGAAVCWDYNPHNGCRLGSNSCSRAHEEMKQKGIHWVAQARLIRRGGSVGTKRLSRAKLTVLYNL